MMLVFWLSTCINWLMMLSVSRPDAMPVSVTAMPRSLQLPAGHDVQGFARRNGLEDVALQVTDLDDHAVGAGVLGEVQLTPLVVQLVDALRGAVDLLAHVSGGHGRNVAEDRVHRMSLHRRRAGLLARRRRDRMAEGPGGQ